MKIWVAAEPITERHAGSSDAGSHHQKNGNMAPSAARILMHL